MLKVLVDFISANWQAFWQAPLAFLVAAIIGFVIGRISLNSQNDTLKERIKLREDQLQDKENRIKEKDEEIAKLNNTISLIKEKLEEKNKLQLKSNKNPYEEKIHNYSNAELSKEAQKMADKLERSIRRASGKGFLEPSLYNEWLSEGPKLLAIKNEIIKRLPSDIAHRLDKISDSRYCSPAFDAQSILEGVNEIRELGLEIAKLATESNSSIM